MQRCHLGSLLGGCHVLFMPRGGLDIAACFHSGKRRVRQDFVNEGFSKRLDAASVKNHECDDEVEWRRGIRAV